MGPRKLIYFIVFFLLSTTPLLSEDSSDHDELIQQIEQQLSILENKMEPMNAMSMIENAYKALRISEQIGYQRGIIKANYILGLSYYYAGDYKATLRHYVAVSSNEVVHHYPHYLSLIHKGKGDLFQDVGLFEWAKQEYDKGIANAQFIKKDNYKHITLSMLYTQLGSLYYNPADNDRMDTATYFFNKVETELKLVDSDFLFPIAPLYLVLKTDRFIHTNQADSAKACVDELFSQINTYRNADFPYIYLIAGRYYEFVQEPDSAEFYYRYALQRSSESGVIKDLPKIYYLMNLFYEKHEEPDSARLYNQLYIDAKNQQAQYKLASSEEIVNTIMQDVKQQSNNNPKKSNLLIIVITYVIAFATTTVIYLHYRKRAKSKSEKQINQLNQQLNLAFDEVIALAKKNDSTFITRFQEVYPTFWSNLTATHPDLSPAELHLCAMTYLNFTTQQIADFAYLQVRSVQTRRSRLRKKIDLDPKEDLYHYLLSFDTE